jgi:hypothetical protein
MTRLPQGKHLLSLIEETACLWLGVFLLSHDHLLALSDHLLCDLDELLIQLFRLGPLSLPLCASIADGEFEPFAGLSALVLDRSAARCSPDL